MLERGSESSDTATTDPDSTDKGSSGDLAQYEVMYSDRFDSDSVGSSADSEVNLNFSASTSIFHHRRCPS
jgi:hypothetical protein